MTLEVCCSTIPDVRNALRGGADRIEICQALSTGGITPSHGFLKACRTITSIPVHVLIRPRPGDFVYDSSEKRIILDDIGICAKLGFAGVVVGALRPDGTPDIEFCRQMKKAAGHLSVTFSRAFDLSNNLHETTNQLIELGYDRILTSGGQPTALEGADMLRELISDHGDSIGFIAASGINRSNFEEVIRRTGVSEIHGSMRRPVPPNLIWNMKILPGLGPLSQGTSTAEVAFVTKRLQELSKE